MVSKQFKMFLIFLVCLTSPVFSENHVTWGTGDQSAAPKLFVKKIHAGGQVVNAIHTTDGNYVSISRTGDANWLVRKSSALGKRIWETSLSFEVAQDGGVALRAIAQISDGYILVGDATFDGTADDTFSSAILVALHSDGTLHWSKGFDRGNLYFNSVTSSPDGGFIVTGGAYPPDFHPILVKFTSAGDIQWQKAFEDLVGSYPLLSARVSDGVIVATPDAIVFKISDSGNLVWKTTLDIEDFSLQALGRASKNGVVLAGTSKNSASLLLTKLNEGGKLGWKVKYHLEGTVFSISNLIHTPDGGFAVTGAAKKESGNSFNGFLLKIDRRRNLAFQRIIGVRGVDEEAQSVFATNEGYVLFGSSRNDILFLRLNANGIAPGCRFFRALNSIAVEFGAVTNNGLEFSVDPLSLPTPATIQMEAAASQRASSIICQN